MPDFIWYCFFFSSRRRHTRWTGDWSSDVCSSDLERRLPGATWIRLQRTVEDAPTALVLLADRHVACGPGGVSLALAPAGPRWSGASGPGRLLSGLRAQATAG